MGGFGVGRLLGFRIRIDYSWFIVLALITWTFATCPSCCMSWLTPW